MYSLEKRLLAVKTYYEMGRNAKTTVRRLGYPDESNISRRVKEYERDQGRYRKADSNRILLYTRTEWPANSESTGISKSIPIKQ